MPVGVPRPTALGRGQAALVALGLVLVVGWVTFALALSDAPIGVAIVGLLAASVAGVTIPIVRRSTAAA